MSGQPVVLRMELCGLRHRGRSGRIVARHAAGSLVVARLCQRAAAQKQDVVTRLTHVAWHVAHGGQRRETRERYEVNVDQVFSSERLLPLLSVVMSSSSHLPPLPPQASSGPVRSHVTPLSSLLPVAGCAAQLVWIAAAVDRDSVRDSAAERWKVC